MIVHGMLDLRVPFSYALDLEARAHAVGVTVETLYFPNQGHAILRSSSDVILPTILDFLFRRMIEE